MKERRKLSSSMEDYLEAIDALKKDKSVARVKDIGERLGVKNSSVNAALGILSRDGFVIHEKYGYVDLTDAGKDVARKVQDRHNVLFKFLTKILKIDHNTASKDACGMEHSVSPKTFRRLTKFIKFVGGEEDSWQPLWLEKFEHYIKTGKKLECRGRQNKKK